MALKSPRRGVQSIRRHHSAALGSFPSRSFYVDATLGNDANSGTYPSEAWQTIGKVNGESFLPGDRILFKRGETWANDVVGRNLIPPSNGIAGNYIIFDAYGTGANPVINAGGSGSPSLQFQVDYVIAQNLELTSTADPPVRFVGSRYCILRNCDIGPSGVTGITVRDDGGVITANNTIRNNNIQGVTNESIYVKNVTATEGVSDTLIESNTVTSGGLECVQNTFEAPATVSPTGTIVRSNIFVDGGDVGCINLWGVVLVEKNWFSGSGGNYSVMHIEHGAGAVIRNNIIAGYAFNRANGCSGIRLTNTVTNASIYHNTIYNISNAGAGNGRGIYCSDGGTGTNIKNNGISGCDDQMIWDAVAPPTADRNAVFGVCSDTGTNAVAANPLLVNPGAGDFHLQVGSPCRGAGAIDTGVTDDYDGVARPDPPTRPDIGAYQFVP